ncbi:Myotubularin-like phosphatase domain [Balamuthia mandrillaris]
MDATNERRLQGWLWKKPKVNASSSKPLFLHKHAAWKKRWFLQVGPALYYYKNQCSFDKPLGNFLFSQIEAVHDHHPLSSTSASSSTSTETTAVATTVITPWHEFSLVTRQGQRMTLRTTSREEKDYWVQGLRQLILVHFGAEEEGGKGEGKGGEEPGRKAKREKAEQRKNKTGVTVELVGTVTHRSFEDIHHVPKTISIITKKQEEEGRDDANSFLKAVMKRNDVTEEQYEETAQEDLVQQINKIKKSYKMVSVAIQLASKEEECDPFLPGEEKVASFPNALISRTKIVNRDTKYTGELHLTNYRIYFCPRRLEDPTESIPYTLISSMDYSNTNTNNNTTHSSSSTIVHLVLHCKNFCTYHIQVELSNAPQTQQHNSFSSPSSSSPSSTNPRTIHKLIKHYISAKSPNDLFAFKNGEKFGLTSELAGWPAYSIRSEFFQRQRLVETQWRVSTANEKYRICPSYPAEWLVPKTCSDVELASSAEASFKGRTIALCWKNPYTTNHVQTAFLFRGSNSCTTLSSLKKKLCKMGLAGGSNKSSSSSSPSSASPTSVSSSSSASSISSASDGVLLEHIWAMRGCDDAVHIVDTNLGARLSSGKETNKLELSQGLRCSLSVFDLPFPFQVEASLQQLSDTISSFGVALESSTSTNLISASSLLTPPSSPSSFTVSSSPSSLTSASHSSPSISVSLSSTSPSLRDSSKYHKYHRSFIWQVKRSNWLQQIKKILSCVQQVVTLLVKGESVIVQNTKGTHSVTQVVALAQLCMDPYYRTIKGFAALITKEWLNFGHKFDSHRRKGEKSFIFVQWMDCVWQLWNQFPRLFEFSESLLHFLLESLYSSRFGTFLVDSEKQANAAKLHASTVSVWTFVDANVSLFLNAFYEPSPILSSSSSSSQPLMAPPPIFPVEEEVTFWSSYFLAETNKTRTMNIRSSLRKTIPKPMLQPSSKDANLVNTKDSPRCSATTFTSSPSASYSSVPSSSSPIAANLALNMMNRAMHFIPEELANLSASITSLDLRNNLITAPTFFFGLLSRLSSLSLSNNSLLSFNMFFLLSLRHLSSTLTSLDLRDNQLQCVPTDFKVLTSLTFLDLANNKLSLLSPNLTNLQQLRHLDLSGNVELCRDRPFPSFIAKLSSLTYHGNRLGLSPFAALSSPSSSSSSSHSLLFPPNLFLELKNLTFLDLADNLLNQETFYPALREPLSQLSSLRFFDFSGNCLSPPSSSSSSYSLLLPPELFASPSSSIFSTLTELRLRDVQANQLPTTLFSKLTHLRLLDLSHNNLILFPSCCCSSLEALHLDHNLLTSVPAEVQRFTSLKQLALSNNNLEYIAPEIGVLKPNLSFLDLSYNPGLRQLPSQLAFLENLYSSKGGRLLLRGCDGITSPPQLVLKEGPDAVLQFLSLLLKGKDSFFRSKLIVVGQEKVGKTSLLQYLSRISKKVPENSKRTSDALSSNSPSTPPKKAPLIKRIIKGNSGTGLSNNTDDDEEEEDRERRDISIGRLCLEAKLQTPDMNDQDTATISAPPSTSEKWHDVEITTWDFSPQAIEMGTHQFFLTPDAVYVLVFDLSLPDSYANLDYWLRAIDARARDAPIMLVGTHLESSSCTSAYLKSWEERLLSFYCSNAQYNIKSISFVSLATSSPSASSSSSASTFNLSKLWNDLAQIVGQQPHVGKALPSSFFEFEKVLMTEKDRLKAASISSVLAYSSPSTLSSPASASSSPSSSLASSSSSLPTSISIQVTDISPQLHNHATAHSCSALPPSPSPSPSASCPSQGEKEGEAEIMRDNEEQLVTAASSPPVISWTKYRDIARLCLLTSEHNLLVATKMLHNAGKILYFGEEMMLQQNDHSSADLINVDDENETEEAKLEGMEERNEVSDEAKKNEKKRQKERENAEEEQAGKMVILDPRWLADVLGALFRSKATGHVRNGVVMFSALPLIWRPPRFPVALHPFILSLLLQFEICFIVKKEAEAEQLRLKEIDREEEEETSEEEDEENETERDEHEVKNKRKNTEEEEEKGRNQRRRILRRRHQTKRNHDLILIPSLLTSERPEKLIHMLWPSRRLEDGIREFGRTYEFAYLPQGFFGRLMVRIMSFNLEARTWWKGGLLVAKGEEKVLMEHLSEQRVIKIMVRSSLLRDNNNTSSETEVTKEKHNKNEDNKKCELVERLQLLSILVFSAMDTLIKEWYCLKARVWVPCTHCLQRGFAVPSLFPLRTCQQVIATTGIPYFLCYKRESPPSSQEGPSVVRVDQLVPDAAMLHLREHKIEFSELVLEEVVGEGAFAKVYKGKWLRNNSSNEGSLVVWDTVAIKKLKIEDSTMITSSPSEPTNIPSLSSSIAASGVPFSPFDNTIMTTSSSSSTSSSSLDDFRQEIWIMSWLQHPNTVSLKGFCMEPPCIVTEYMPNGSLFEFLHDEERSKVLTWPLRLKIVKDIAKACAFMHSATPPIMHRDLKSPNILLNDLSEDSAVVAKVSDFGISLTSGTTGRAARRVDCPVWLAPEVMRSEEYGPKADVYSFGIICWEVVSKRRFFGHLRWSHHIEAKICNGEREDIPKECLPEFAELIQRCWQDDPSKRPPFVEIVETIDCIFQKYFGEEVTSTGRRHVNYDQNVNQTKALEKSLSASLLNAAVVANGGMLVATSSSSPSPSASSFFSPHQTNEDVRRIRRAGKLEDRRASCFASSTSKSLLWLDASTEEANRKRKAQSLNLKMTNNSTKQGNTNEKDSEVITTDKKYSERDEEAQSEKEIETETKQQVHKEAEREQADKAEMMTGKKEEQEEAEERTVQFTASSEDGGNEENWEDLEEAEGWNSISFASFSRSYSIKLQRFRQELLTQNNTINTLSFVASSKRGSKKEEPVEAKTSTLTSSPSAPKNIAWKRATVRTIMTRDDISDDEEEREENVTEEQAKTKKEEKESRRGNTWIAKSPTTVKLQTNSLVEEEGWPKMKKKQRSLSEKSSTNKVHLSPHEDIEKTKEEKGKEQGKEKDKEDQVLTTKERASSTTTTTTNVKEERNEEERKEEGRRGGWVSTRKSSFQKQAEMRLGVRATVSLPESPFLPQQPAKDTEEEEQKKATTPSTTATTFWTKATRRPTPTSNADNKQGQWQRAKVNNKPT